MTVEIDGTKVRELRTDRGWTQEHLADLVARVPRTIQRVETTNKCAMETRSALASVFNVAPSELQKGDSANSICQEIFTSYAPAPALPLSPRSLFAYANSHPRPNALIHQLAVRRTLAVQSFDSESAYLNEHVASLQIETVRELDELVVRHAVMAERISDYLQPQSPVDSGFLLSLVLDVYAIERLGLPAFIKYREALRYSSGGRRWAEEIYEYYVELKANLAIPRDDS